jgi:hypothetical protein
MLPLILRTLMIPQIHRRGVESRVTPDGDFRGILELERAWLSD